MKNADTEGTVELDAAGFRAMVVSRKAAYEELGSYPTCIVLPTDLEPLIQHQFFRGKLNDIVAFNTDSKGVLRMYLAGIKTMFHDSIFIGHTVWVLDQYPPKPTDGAVTPPSNTPEPRPPTPPAQALAA